MFSLIEPMRPASHDDVKCEAVMRNGKQCHFAAEDGEIYCRRHRQLSPTRRFEYNAAIQMPKVPRNQLFDLTAEVMLLKQLIAARLEQIKDSDGIILYSGHIADLLTRLQKLVDGAVKLEVAKGELLSRQAAMALIGSIMHAVADVVKDVDLIEKIHDRIQDTLLMEPKPTETP